ncbi:DDE-domain-containing protein [Calocera cornea HHB12733]|uniref:DDE-domain-containing protein n=1 Tax=Calocera cornea HHB12733 TaxID=1353952 RepID=A0A165DMF7_9BASI|nr:DDE-domain-containing protein [Calocera cornea HHB12733]
MLKAWLLQAEADGLAVSGKLIRTQWRWFATEEDIPPPDWPKLSEGWLTAFKRRHNLKGYHLHGEAGAADPSKVDQARQRIQDITDAFTLRDIFNMDETGLFGKMPPNRTLATKQMSGRKTEKHRLSYAFTVNADGSEKLEPLIIGRFRRPHCFQSRDGSYYGYDYHWNKKAWMKTDIFQQYLEKFDRKMRQENRHVLLLVDNFSGHKYDETRITNVRVEFFEPNLTAHIQPLDQGIIHAFKLHYRRLFCEWAVLRQVTGVAAPELYLINQLEIMELAQEAWGEISRETIANCWRRAGILQLPRDINGRLQSPDLPLVIEPNTPTMQDDPSLIAIRRELQDVIVTLQERGALAPLEAMSTTEMVNVTGESVGSERWTDREILEQVREEIREEHGQIETAEEEEDVPVSPLFSDQQALAACLELQRLFATKPHCEYQAGLSMLPGIMRALNRDHTRSLEQSSITKYFALPT